MQDLMRLADLIRTRNAVDSEIAAAFGRHALIGHAGEYVGAIFTLPHDGSPDTVPK